MRYDKPSPGLAATLSRAGDNQRLGGFTPSRMASCSIRGKRPLCRSGSARHHPSTAGKTRPTTAHPQSLLHRITSDLACVVYQRSRMASSSIRGKQSTLCRSGSARHHLTTAGRTRPTTAHPQSLLHRITSDLACVVYGLVEWLVVLSEGLILPLPPGEGSRVGEELSHD